MANELSELLARVSRLEDLEAIRATWLDYCNRLDSADFVGLGDVFTDDATLHMDGLAPTLDGTYRGRRSIIDDFYARTESAASAAAGPGAEQGDGASAPPRRYMTGHLSTNMQIDLPPGADEASTLAYFFEIVDDDLVLIGTYQHRMRRCPDRWRFGALRISIRYRARLEVDHVGGQSLRAILARPI